MSIKRWEQNPQSPRNVNQREDGKVDPVAIFAMPEDAALAVRAVNGLPSLIETLRMTVWNIKSLPTEHPHWLTEIEAAIQKAEGALS